MAGGVKSNEGILGAGMVELGRGVSEKNEYDGSVSLLPSTRKENIGLTTSSRKRRLK